VLPAALARGERVLVLCNANAAVDSVLEKVSLSGGAVILRCRWLSSTAIPQGFTY
jgi:hypothetical protein